MKQQQKNTAFYIEALVLTFFLLACLTVLVQMFGAARTMGRNAAQQAAAVAASQSAQALFEAGALAPMPEAGKTADLALYFDEDGRQLTETEAAAAVAYTVAVHLDGTETPAGRMVKATLAVTGADAPDAVLCTLATEKYLPG